MSLPSARFSKTTLDAYLQHTAVVLPTPPTDPSTWTTLFHLIGPGPLVAQDDRGATQVCDASLLRELLKGAGRPCRDEEQEALLLVSPIPGDTTVQSAVAGALSHRSYTVRHRAALLLGHIGDASDIPALMANTSDSDDDARRGAIEALGRLGARREVAALMARAWDGYASVNVARLLAVNRLGLWDDVAEAVEASDENECRDLAMAILVARGGGDVNALTELFENDDDDIKRASFLYCASDSAVAERCAHALAEVLSTETDEDVTPALVCACGAAGRAIVEPLAELLESDNWQARMYAAAALGYVGEPALALEEALVERLADDDYDVMREAALALTALGRGSAKTETLIREHNTRSYGFSARALDLGERSAVLRPMRAVTGLEPVGPDLLLYVANKGGDERGRCIASLLIAAVEPDLSHAVLDAMARDDSGIVPLRLRRFAAAGCLLSGHLPGDLATTNRILLCHKGEVSGLVGGSVQGLRGRAPELTLLAMRDGDWAVRIDALRLLERLGDEALPFAQTFAWLSRHDPDVDCRNQAAGMASMGWGQRDPAALLAQILLTNKGGSDEGRASAMRELAARSPSLAATVAQPLATDSDRGLARAASVILGGMFTPDDAGRALIDGAVARLEDDHWVARESACDLLGAVPPSAIDAGVLEEVVEALRSRAVDDDDSDVQNAAKAAMSRLGHPFVSED